MQYSCFRTRGPRAGGARLRKKPDPQRVRDAPDERDEVVERVASALREPDEMMDLYLPVTVALMASDAAAHRALAMLS